MFVDARSISLSVTAIGVPALIAFSMVAGCKRNTPLSSSPPTDSRIVGLWTIEGGDYPLTDNYRADGMRVQEVNGRKAQERPYRIEGDNLIVVISQAEGTLFEQKERFAIEGDTLSFVDTDGSKRVFRRR